LKKDKPIAQFLLKLFAYNRIILRQIEISTI